ncbi:hypothetical protein O7606_21015 [Micromonospora sp. WMMD882]|uniref:hypothetical protein n=1 Tax=Micromonospora sp. WMMD882 TaxID=3015151 RepID=UPI00248CCF69|nr:hypothetical protein [Micromonospora sp. WMMD882]WBB78670.1 hypothetical protein O7606_21015 [Micromonospora sp. WMMD882]
MTGYGRSDDEWDLLTEAGLELLIEQARLGAPTTYTDFDAALRRRTGLRGFDFDQESERAAIGRLLGLIVERDYETTGLLISALVRYLNANDAGPGFYALAVQRGLLPPKPSALAKEKFWIDQVNALHAYYGSSRGNG